MNSARKTTAPRRPQPAGSGNAAERGAARLARKALLAAGLGLSLLTLGPAQAGFDGSHQYLAQAGNIPWQSLSPQEKRALQRFRNQWDTYSGRRQQEMRQGAQRYMELPPQKRREVEQQRHQYQQLTPEERRRLRDEYQRQRH